MATSSDDFKFVESVGFGPGGFRDSESDSDDVI